MPADAESAAADPLYGTGIATALKIHHNSAAAQLVAHAVRRGEGRLAESGALIVRTGVHTGRSVQDKFIVEEPGVEGDVWWGKINQRLSPAHFASLKGRVQAYCQGHELFVQDLFAGADPARRLSIRLVTTGAWQALFARNMFIRPTEQELESFSPDFVILHAPGFLANPALDGSRGGTAIALSFAQRTIVIAGTQYAGEVKKAVFSVMNWLLPPQGVLPMHCSANVGARGDVALFFGLSGTGKTTLSSDPTRRLIGDDEHGWGPDGVFNFEAGCYAKVIDLSEEAEPEIWAATHRFGTVLENVVADTAGRVDLADKRHTENTRACYPISHIPHVEPSGRGGHPRHLVMLTADAFGVLPPLARLTPAQTSYHFLSGYTARVAGTEKGLGAKPQATFSPSFGAPFLPRWPNVYSDMLTELIARHDVDCWLVNTGWTGGPYGVGWRMSIRHTRALLRAALSGALEDVPFHADPVFGLQIPDAVRDVPTEALAPRGAWADPDAYDQTAHDLLARFERNFRSFGEHAAPPIRIAAAAQS